MASTPTDVAYREPSHTHRWQCDVYPREAFPNGPPKPEPAYWMLLNRTCDLVEGNGRSVKVGMLVFCAALPIDEFLSMSASSKTFENQIRHIIEGRNGAHVAFLPENPAADVPHPLIANFHLIQSVPEHNWPAATCKVLQLKSPFAEYVMQRFARCFYTVSIDDEVLRDSDYISQIASQLPDR